MCFGCLKGQAHRHLSKLKSGFFPELFGHNSEILLNHQFVNWLMARLSRYRYVFRSKEPLVDKTRPIIDEI